jgi:hypothetical protein
MLESKSHVPNVQEWNRSWGPAFFRAPARGFPHRSNVLPAAYAWNFWNDGTAPLSSRAKEKARLDVWPFPESVTPDARKMS